MSFLAIRTSQKFMNLGSAFSLLSVTTVDQVLLETFFVYESPNTAGALDLFEAFVDKFDVIVQTLLESKGHSAKVADLIFDSGVNDFDVLVQISLGVEAFSAFATNVVLQIFVDDLKRQ